MPSSPQLSNALRITNVNDFLTPAANCVLPLGGAAAPAGSVLAPIIPTTDLSPTVDPTTLSTPSATTTATSTSTSTSTVATVTVSDCLSCSGCVTSADTVLLSTASLDSLRTFLSAVQRPSFCALVVLSQQSVASIAVAHSLPLAATARKLATFLHHTLHFDVILDGSFARHFALLEASAEFIARRKTGHKLTITSACPGWLTYAEKTQPPDILACLSEVRSPQAVVAALARRMRPQGDERKPWVLSIAQCHDKKLEAKRPEFATESSNEDDVDAGVDCVITTTELMQLIEEHGFDLATASERMLDAPHATSEMGFGVAVGSGSDGFADFVLRKAARELLDVRLPHGPLAFEKSSKSGDMRSICVKDEKGERQLRFATAYGFRSLQSIVRKIRKGDCTFDYIELMACPGGCCNGGGQIAVPEMKMDEVKTDSRSFKQHSAMYLRRVHEKFAEAPEVEEPLEVPTVRAMYDECLGGEPRSACAKEALSITVQSRQTTSVTPASLEW